MRTGGQYQFKTPEDLRNAAQAYFDYCDKNPIRGARMVKTDGDDKELRDDMHPRPYTFEGLCEYIDIWDWTQFVNDNKEREGFAPVLGWIRNKIRRNQIEGGLVGLYRENLTARLNGITDNLTDQTPPPSTIEVRYTE